MVLGFSEKVKLTYLVYVPGKREDKETIQWELKHPSTHIFQTSFELFFTKVKYLLPYQENFKKIDIVFLM